jgi:predicted RNA methylase
LDLKPEAAGIQEQNWLEYVHVKKEDELILVIGNPPFGQQNSLAIAFINHAAKFADRVAFILPISFKKESIQNRIDLSMHLTYEEDTPKNSFTFDGIDYDVKCVFQIWDKKETLRSKPNRANLTSNNLFEFVKKSASPDAVIQRIGGNAGKASAAWSEKSEQSNYFIKFKNPIHLQQLDTVLKELNQIAYPSRNHAVGPRSISKGELNEEINKVFKS